MALRRAHGDPGGSRAGDRPRAVAIETTRRGHAGGDALPRPNGDGASQRTREIGIRSALGAQPRQLLLGLFGRAMRQLSLGLLVGSLASVGVFVAAGIGVRPAAAMLLTVAMVMALVASFAALGPARRSLRLSAVEALRVEG
jgi:FtsX-like permease family protein